METFHINRICFLFSPRNERESMVSTRTILERVKEGEVSQHLALTSQTLVLHQSFLMALCLPSPQPEDPCCSELPQPFAQVSLWFWESLLPVLCDSTSVRPGVRLSFASKIIGCSRQRGRVFCCMLHHSKPGLRDLGTVGCSEKGVWGMWAGAP